MNFKANALKDERRYKGEYAMDKKHGFGVYMGRWKEVWRQLGSSKTTWSHISVKSYIEFDIIKL